MIMSSQPRDIGIRANNIALLLPKKFTDTGPAMAPVNLPMLSIDANQSAWLSVMELFFLKFAITGDDQPDVMPICTSTSVAEI